MRAYVRADFSPRASRIALERFLRERRVPEGLFDPAAIERGDCTATARLLFPRVKSWELRISDAGETQGVAVGLPERQFGEAAELLRWGSRTNDARRFRREFSFLGRNFLDAHVGKSPVAALRQWPGADSPGLYRREHACVIVRSEATTLILDPISQVLGRFYPRVAAVPIDETRPDAVLITHGHSDHWHLPSILHSARDRAIRAVVPHVPRPSILSTDDFSRQLRMAGQNTIVARWGSTVRVGDIEIDALPFYGEQPSRDTPTVNTDIRNWGNCYRVNTPGFSALFMADGGADPAGDMTEVARDSRRRRGPVDAVLLCVRAFPGPFFGGLSRDWLPLRFDDLRAHHRLYRRGRLASTTAGPAGIAAICAAAGARYFLPYADGFEGVGKPISDVSWGEGEPSEAAISADIAARIARRRTLTKTLSWRPGDAAFFDGGTCRIARVKPPAGRRQPG